MSATAPTAADLQAARNRIAPLVRRTPVLHCEALDQLAGCSVHFKCENLQHGGAFKFRGASNAVFSLTNEQAKLGVVTHSSGNHAGAVALAAQRRGIPAHIVVPHNLPKIKLANIQSFGGIVTFCEASLQSRTETCDRIMKQTGACMVHPFDDDRVIAGQSTLAQELFEQVPGLNAIFVPVSGGGLISGIALAAAHFSPATEIYGSEPAIADDAAQSLHAGKLQPGVPTAQSTIADGLRAALSPRTFAIIQKNVRDILTVTEQQIIQAMKLIWNHLKVVAEPSAAVSFAAALAHKDKFAGLKIAIILSGGNVDLDKLPWQN